MTSADASHKANVLVCARIRPLFVEDADVSVVRILGTDDSVSIKGVDDQQEEETFYFDRTFDEQRSAPHHLSECNEVQDNAHQQRVYESIGRPLLEHQCRGVSTAVIVYGPTGSGKSHTMVGTRDSPGLAIRMLAGLKDLVHERFDKRFNTVTMHLSMFEMLGERFRDLLRLSEDLAAPAAGAPLQRSATLSQQQLSLSKRTKSSLGPSTGEGDFIDLRIRSTSAGVHADGLKRVQCDDDAAIEELVWSALMQRSAIARGRSASGVLGPKVQTMIECTVKVTDRVHSISRTSTLRLVDMCGSEKANRVRAAGSIGNVHRSLHALKAVVDALVEINEPANSNHRRISVRAPVVPYRDSQFTLLLSDALGGSCRTTVVATVAPGSKYYEESLYALAAVHRMKAISCNVSTREETVDCAVGALQKELTLLRQMAEDGNGTSDSDGGTEMQDALRTELASIDAQMQSVAVGREALEIQKAEIQARLDEHERQLNAMHSELSHKSSMLQQSKSMEAELSAVVEKQLSAAQQVANAVALQEKRNAQLIVHRQRQASIVRRHEKMVTNMESAKQVAEKSRRREFGSIFRLATALTSQRNDVRFYRGEIDRMMKRESELYDRLRALQASTTEAAKLNSEEQLKCDFLTEELDEVVESWEDANRLRAQAIADHRIFMADHLEAVASLKEDIRDAEAACEASAAAKHDASFQLGIRVAEAEAESADVEDELKRLEVELNATALSNVPLSHELAVGREEEALLPARQRMLCEAQEVHRQLTDQTCRREIECEAIASEICALEREAIPVVDQEASAARELLVNAQATLRMMYDSQQSLEKYVRKRVFSQETKAASDAQHTASPLRRQSIGRGSPSLTRGCPSPTS